MDHNGNHIIVIYHANNEDWLYLIHPLNSDCLLYASHCGKKVTRTDRSLLHFAMSSRGEIKVIITQTYTMKYESCIIWKLQK